LATGGDRDPYSSSLERTGEQCSERSACGGGTVSVRVTTETAEDGVRTVRVVFAAYDSAASGKAVLFEN